MHTGNVRVIFNHVRPFRFSVFFFFFLLHPFTSLHMESDTAPHDSSLCKTRSFHLGLSFLVRRQSHRLGYTHTIFRSIFPFTYCPEICYILYSFEFNTEYICPWVPPGNLSGRGIIKSNTKKNIKKVVY